jgi:hypothetical protein
LGRFIAICAIIRCTLAALYLAMRVWSGNIPDYDVIIVDQVAAVVPLLKMVLPGTRVLFYCHFPDLLLSQRSSVFKSLYRFPLDYLEQSSTGAADLILVNSNFTAGVFGQTFKRLARQGVEPAVLYPAVSIPSESVLAEASKVWKKELSEEIVHFIWDKPVFLSINRWVVWVDVWVQGLCWCARRQRHSAWVLGAWHSHAQVVVSPVPVGLLVFIHTACRYILFVCCSAGCWCAEPVDLPPAQHVLHLFPPYVRTHTQHGQLCSPSRPLKTCTIPGITPGPTIMLS